MPLLERITTLIKANVNDLITKAENPEKLLKQLLLDMQNQFMQVKTQVAQAIAELHLLEKKQQETLSSQREWVRKAEMAFNRQDQDLTRTALERSVTFENAARGYAQQVEEQSHQVQLLREIMHRLEQKMSDTKLKADLLIAQFRRAKLAQRAGLKPEIELKQDLLLESAQTKIEEADVLASAHLRVAAAEPLDPEAEVDRLLDQLKQRANTRAIGPAR